MKVVQYAVAVQIPLDELKKWRVVGIDTKALDTQISHVANGLRRQILANWHKDIDDPEIHKEVPG